MESPYEQGLNRVAPPGKKPKQIRVERWEGRTRPIKSQSQDTETTSQLQEQAQRYINNWVEAMYEPEPGEGEDKANDQQ